MAPEVDQPGEVLGPGPVVVTGVAGPGAVVEVVVNGEPLGLTVAGPEGRWIFVVTLPTSGAYAFEARAIDAAGTVLAAGGRVELSVPTATPSATLAPTITPVPAAEVPDRELPPTGMAGARYGSILWTLLIVLVGLMMLAVSDRRGKDQAGSDRQ